jgi:hypothetical protein
MRRVSVREPHAIIGNGINVWRGDVLAAVHTDIGVTEVISEEDDDIGFVSGSSNLTHRHREARRPKHFHGVAHANIPLCTRPLTSVSRMSRPAWRRGSAGAYGVRRGMRLGLPNRDVARVEADNEKGVLV